MFPPVPLSAVYLLEATGAPPGAGPVLVLLAWAAAATLLATRLVRLR